MGQNYSTTETEYFRIYELLSILFDSCFKNFFKAIQIIFVLQTNAL